MRQIAAILALSIVLAGCGNGSSTATPAPSGTTTGSGGAENASGRTTASAPLAGEWKGKIEIPAAQKDDPGAKLGEAFSEMMSFKLEIKPDDTYVMTAFVVPITGKLTRNGDEITLTPEKIMGMTPEEYKKANADKPNTMEPDMKPLKGKVNEDNSKITFIDDKDQKGNLVFSRVPAKVVGASTVTPEEQKFVSEYKGQIDRTKIKPEDKSTLAMEPYLKLNLDADNTFHMSVGMDMDGTWKLTGDKITLTPKDASFKGPNGEAPQFKIDGEKLVPIGATTPFYFVKK